MCVSVCLSVCLSVSVSLRLYVRVSDELRLYAGLGKRPLNSIMMTIFIIFLCVPAQ